MLAFTNQLDQWHKQVRQNIWFHVFTWFNRLVLALGFIPSGMQKVVGERFTDLSIQHPMGNYLEAIYHTGYYYTFIGIAQVTAAILLLIPRTATLGALIYFPIILNICVLSFAVRFDGSMVTAPLMLLACLYLLCWDYDKWKMILPFQQTRSRCSRTKIKELEKRFPFLFFGSVVMTVIVCISIFAFAYKIMPRNTLADCQHQCAQNDTACLSFCDCIHQEGYSLEQCLSKHKDEHSIQSTFHHE